MDDDAGIRSDGDADPAADGTGRLGLAPRLDVLKTLGDNTRYAIYLELARSSAPLTTADVARSLDLHPNTVRPHLERMRDVGLLDVQTASLGGVGRPQHRYSLAADAPSLGLEPPVFPMMARMLLKVATDAGAAREDAVDVARAQGRHDAATTVTAATGPGGTDAGSLPALVDHLETLGFDPQVVPDGETTTIGFAHCPFADLAAANPDLVCGLHQGLVEGFVRGCGDTDVTAFRSLTDRNPCQMDVVSVGGAP